MPSTEAFTAETLPPTATWEPPPRPDWVTAINRAGHSTGSPASLVSLSEASLLDAATAATGLTDFGDDEWREPFRILLDDLEREAELTLVGRLLARAEILRSLGVRLRMAETERQHPEILEQPVEAPIFITGMGRTGTSILFELMGQDPALRAPAGWELRYPSPPPVAGERLDDRRIDKTAADVASWLQVVPEFTAVHEIAITEPDECSVGQQHEFTSPVWGATARVPNYDAWLTGSGMTQAFRFHRRLLRHLQWKTPGQWILKAPAHLSCLPSLFAEYPDARIIHTHRDPLTVLASTADMMATLRWQRSDRVTYDEIAATVGLGYPILLDIVVEQRSGGAVPDDRFVDVRYADFIRDAIGTIGTIYQRLGLELTDDAAERMRRYVEAKPKGRHSGRSYRFEHLRLDEATLRAQFAGYMERFDVPEEKS